MVGGRRRERFVVSGVDLREMRGALVASLLVGKKAHYLAVYFGRGV